MKSLSHVRPLATPWTECVSFTHPFYNSFSAGTTVYSLTGQGNRLYAGTNDSIKIYDISDPTSPVLVSSFSTNNARVNDLEIEGDVLFAATSKGLYKLDASDLDELTQILFVSTGSTSQNEIELYDGKVYAREKQKFMKLLEKIERELCEVMSRGIDLGEKKVNGGPLSGDGGRGRRWDEILK